MAYLIIRSEMPFLSMTHASIFAAQVSKHILESLGISNEFSESKLNSLSPKIELRVRMLIEELKENLFDIDEMFEGKAG
jgi:hypothetical protein